MMITKTATAPDADSLPSLLMVPKHARAKDGQLIDTSGDSWQGQAAADGGKRIYFNWMLLDADRCAWELPERERTLLRLFVLDRIRRTSVRDAENAFKQLRYAVRWFVEHLRRDDDSKVFTWRSLTYGEILALLRAGDDDAMRGGYFNRLRHFFRWGVQQGFPDFSPALLAKLVVVRAQGNLKGHAVRSHDPLKGPFSDDERRAMADAVIAKRGAPADRAIVMLMRELGLNPLSAVRIKNEHLLRFEAVTAERRVVKYQLRVPRVKKGTATTHYRTRPISNTLGDLLQQLASGAPGDRLLHWLRELSPEGAMNAAMQRWADEAKIVSARTGDTLHLFARRFRHTYGTELADDGYSLEFIRDALDHTDLQNVGVYIDSSPRVLDHISDRMDPKLSPLLGRFLGTLIERPPSGGRRRQVVPGTAVEIPEMPLDVGGIGCCGRDVSQDGLCGKGGVLGCYTCPVFQAFLDGPHARVLERLEAAAGRMVATGDEALARQVSPCVQAIRQLLAQVTARLGAPATP